MRPNLLCCFLLYTTRISSFYVSASDDGLESIVSKDQDKDFPVARRTTRTTRTTSIVEEIDTNSDQEDVDNLLKKEENEFRNTSTMNGNSTQHCVDYADCQSCNDASWCHWCGTALGCHVQGSIHGCFRGETCRGDQPAPSPSNNNNNDTCLSHETCADCSLYSRWCHWCAHDNSCHLIGSFYGCVRGVDCYDITHCKRAVPEPIRVPQHHQSNGFGLQWRLIPTIIATVFVTLTICCATLCCCAVRLTKNAYEDLLMDMDFGATMTPLLNRSEEPAAVQAAIVPPITESNVDAEQQQGQVDTAEATDPADTANDHRPDTQDEEPSQRQRTRRPRRTIHRLYHACVGCYLVAIVAVSAVSFAIIKYFPQIPQYSICNDAVAWQSIVDAMAHMSVAADFQLLASIQNSNYLDVQVVTGQGSFYHGKNYDYVGSFELPATTIQQRSITDLLVTATFAPDKWKALSIGAEYYAGTLMLSLDSQVTIRIPLLLDYTFTAIVKDLVVNVNQAADRHLCACPTWTDARTPVPLWMTDAPLSSSSSSALDVDASVPLPQQALLEPDDHGRITE